MISIIIPTFNRAKVLPFAINSILEQTSNEWELIIIDDGSWDETATVVDLFIKDSRIKYFRQHNKGASAARNEGAEKSTGEYLIFLDSDDTLNRKTIDLIHSANISDVDLIFWNVKRTIDGRDYIQQPVPLGGIYNDIKGIFLAGSFCLRKKVFFEIGKYDTQIFFGENYELGLRISDRQQLKLIYIKEVLLNYQISTDSRASDAPERRVESHLYQLEKHKSKYLKDPAEHSKMLHIIAYNLERCGRIDEAQEYYKSSWKKYPLKIKPILKLLHLWMVK